MLEVLPRARDSRATRTARVPADGQRKTTVTTEFQQLGCREPGRGDGCDRGRVGGEYVAPGPVTPEEVART